MSRRGLRPRPDQISLLTQGVTLPLSAVPHEHLDVIIEAIFDAFTFVKMTYPAIILSNSEIEITTAVRNQLTRTLPDHQFLRLIVNYIARGEEHLSYNGEHIEKRPDFSFALAAQDRIFPLLAEAKVISTTQSQSVESYCEKGILRFIQGEYSWWDRDAIMIAYVSNGQSPAGHLTPVLQTDKLSVNPLYLTKNLPKAVVLNTQKVPRSEHSRKFRYNLGAVGTGRPGTISLWHVWLS